MLYLIPIFMPPASTSPNIDNSLVLPVSALAFSITIAALVLLVLALPFSYYQYQYYYTNYCTGKWRRKREK